MKVIIAGCGKVGAMLVASMLEDGHDVTIIDPDTAVVEEITNVFDVMCVCGKGTDFESLAEADAGNADLFIAASGSDEKNMLSCFLAKKMGAKHTVARIRDTEYSQKSIAFVRQHLDLAMVINPDQLAAQEIFNILKLPSAAKIEYFGRRNFAMMEMVLSSQSPLCGHSLMNLRKKYDVNFLICVLQRNEKVIIPDGNLILNEGDRIELAATPGEIQRLLKMIGTTQKQAKNVMIVGGSRVTYFLAKMLLSAGSNVTIVEQNEQRCTELSESLPGARIIWGDGAHQETLQEEGIRSMDAFVSLTGMDEQNILLSYFAQSQGVNKIITKVNRSEFKSITGTLHLDTLISPKVTVSSQITRYARALQNSIGSNVEALYRLMNGQAEAIEFSVQPTFKKINTKLMDMHFKPGILVAGIIRGRKPMIPTGVDVIQSGDRVIIVAKGSNIKNLEDILI